MSHKDPPSSHHQGAYRGRQGRTYLDTGAMLRLLVRPRRTFEQLWHHTGAAQGIIVAILIIAVTTVLNMAIFWFFSGGDDVFWAREDQFAATRGLLSLDPLWTGVVLALVNFFLTTSLVYALVKAAGDAKKPDLRMTFGLVGYAMFPVLCIGIVMSVVVAIYGTNITDFQETTGGLAEDYGDWGQFRIVYLAMAVAMLLWGLRTHAAAASVANDSAPGRTLGLTLVAWIISYNVFFAAIQLYFWLVEGEWADVPWLPVVLG